MGRPPSDLDEYLDWQERLASFEASDLEIDVFCLKEGVSRSTFYRWKDRLRDGVPDSLIAEKEARTEAESAEGAAFVPISLKASPVEIDTERRHCTAAARRRPRIPATLTSAERQRILSLSESVATLWHAPETSALRKSHGFHCFR